MGLILGTVVLLGWPLVLRPLYGDDFVFLDYVRARSLPAAVLGHDPIGPFYRPLSEVVYFWVVGRLSEAPWLFHAINLGLVLAIALTLHGLVASLKSQRAGLVAAAVWAVHYCWQPTVLWASGSQDLLATLAALLAMWLARRDRPWLAAGALLAALLAKETALACLALALLLGWRRERTSRSNLASLVPLLVAPVLWALLWWPRFSADLAATPSYVSARPGGAVYALLHLLQVVPGLEWQHATSYAPKVFDVAAAVLACVGLLWAVPKAGTPRGHSGRIDPLWLCAGWMLLGALPISAVAGNWSAYQYMFAVTGWAALVGIASERFGRWPVVVLVAALATGSTVGRSIEGNAQVPRPTNTLSHVNVHSLTRAQDHVALYLARMKELYPSPAPRTTFFFAGLPASLGWQSGNGALLRWAYADTTLRSYFLSEYRRERAERGPVIFIRADDRGLYPLAGQTLLRQIAVALLAGDRIEGAADALDAMLQDVPDPTARYYRAWVAMSLGDSLQAHDLLRQAGLTPSRGPLPEWDTVADLVRRDQAMEAIGVLATSVERHELDPDAHAALSDLLGRFPEGQDGALVEAFAARALAPQRADLWARWAQVQVRAQRYAEARASLQEAIRLSPGGRNPSLESVLKTLPVATAP